MPELSRREFLKTGAASAAASYLASRALCAAEDVKSRMYHVCLAPDVIEKNPELLKTVQDAGISTVWVCGFFYGHWPYTLDAIRAARAKIEALGMRAQLINIPLGHPGDSLGSSNGPIPLTPPKHWKMGTKSDGRQHSGTSLHDPATAENVKALRDLAPLGATDLFLDDDFRLAVSPGMVGGCYCNDHKNAFLKKSGFGEQQWTDLVANARARQLTPALKTFLEFNCDELTASFRAQQGAWSPGRLGNMVMYMGAEKAGIRLSDYKDCLLRVGEGHFDNNSFGSVKGKTDELFSVLFHRRFTTPQLAFSESTAYPANNLSAKNMAAKIPITTIAGINNSMFMSGLTPFPIEHWSTLKPAMKKNAMIHERLAGHSPKGPFKHYWGEAGRYVGDDNPFSLFLASGIPFEVCDSPAADGFTFLGAQDAAAAANGALKSAGTQFVHQTSLKLEGARAIGGKLEDIFALKREIVPALKDASYVLEDKPVVLAWYPTAKLGLLWNLTERTEEFTVRFGTTERKVDCAGLDLELVDFNV